MSDENSVEESKYQVFYLLLSIIKRCNVSIEKCFFDNFIEFLRIITPFPGK